MELIGFILVFLVCMGVAKAINAACGRLVVNGAGIFLLLSAVFVGWIIAMAWQSTLPGDDVAYALGRHSVPVLIMSAVAAYYFFNFRSEKAHQRHVQKLRQARAEADANAERGA
jgi:hypothetical protein